MTYTEQNVPATVVALLEQHGLTAPVTVEQLDLLDQYHTGGIAAVDRTIAGMRLTDADRVLDVGSGFGGPARRIAQTTGARVHGVDIARSYVDTAVRLTDMVGFGDRCSFECTPVEDLHAIAPYTAALSMHVQMNVEHKAEWYRSIAGHLAPGARFAVWDVCATGTGELSYPLPWSMDGTDSFVPTIDELADAITSAGFTTVEWVDEAAWVAEWSTAVFGAGLPSGPGIPMVIEDGYNRVFNFIGAFQQGLVTVARGLFTTSAG
jgi:SAM-dependent methyltransferase